jgi:two-component system, OmpR family, sensor kinase
VKSLYLRLLVSMWLTMALLVGIFALIHARAIADQTDGPRRRFGGRTLQLRAESALQCQKDGRAACEASLTPIEPRDDRVTLYRNGRLLLGEPVRDAAALESTARAAPDGIAFRSNGEDATAVVLKRDASVLVIGVGPVRSPWMFFIGPDTLPYRLAAIVAVTGLVSLLLARYLSRPLRVLRAATQRMAQGDLSVRVSDGLRGADGETLALGRDMDSMAERLHEVLEAQRRLLRDVSHELRSPLARLGISLELVRRKSSPDVTPALDRIERETERLNAMIGELLTLSRLEAKGRLDQTEPVDLAALLHGIGEDAALEAEGQNTKLATRVAEGCIVAGNAELLRRAIENVVRNAVRFTEPGTTVDVELERRNGAAQVRVRDHGPGVPSESLARIFEPFYRVEDDRARTRGGTGIGLAITERAIAVHGGSVTAQNAAGGGLEITIVLPAAEVA